MVLKRPFQSPTQVIQGYTFDEALEKLLDDRRWALITSAGWVSRGILKNLQSRRCIPETVIADIESNPGLETVTRTAQSLSGAEVVVALGGGSVIDTAKGAVALQALNQDTVVFNEHLREGRPLPEPMTPAPIIAVPTTSGTGSEVTCWGTIWGEEGIKHSVNHPALRPKDAILDPALCVSMPRDLTIATALDALSHAMESVWNRNHTPITDALATQSIGIIRNDLSATLAMPDNHRLRERIQTAALLSGLAMGTTQTAVAHSISYPFTSRFGVPHGLACSFTLPEVARYNMEAAPDRLTPIADGLGCIVDDIPASLETWLDELGIGELLGLYVTPDVVDTFGDSLVNRSRAANNICDVDGDSAR